MTSRPPGADISHNRREFLRSVGRGAALGALAALGVTLLTDSRRDAACIGRGACRGCPAFNGCDLPAAEGARKEPPRQ